MAKPIQLSNHGAVALREHSINPDQSAIANLQKFPHPREKTIAQYMDQNPNAPRCSRCGERCPLPEDLNQHPIPPDTAAVVCSPCTRLLAALWSKGYWKDMEDRQARKCRQCGISLHHRGRQRFCAACRKIRNRDAVRRHRRNPPKTVSDM